MKSLRGKTRRIMFLEFNPLLSQQAAGNLTQERLKLILTINLAFVIRCLSLVSGSMFRVLGSGVVIVLRTI